MNCPKCSGKTRVVDSVNNHVENETYRRLKCTECGTSFYTVEIEAEADKRFTEEWNRYHRNKHEDARIARRRKE